ncbi:tetratricopeptide repeat protein [Candidatus Thorarchaeota archaeon]|nr:MAG: tetratricopeptide repeat protein [Candidatus Thorarchaeota archaeon]
MIEREETTDDAVTRRSDEPMTPREADLRLRLKTFPRDAFAWYMLGKHLRSRGRHEEAEAALRKAVALNPGPNRFWEELASALMDLGQLDEAYELADRIRGNKTEAKAEVAKLEKLEKSIDDIPSPCVSCEHYTYYGCSKGVPCEAFNQCRARMVDKPASS